MCHLALKGLDWSQLLKRVDDTMHWIHHYPVHSVVCFVNISPLERDLSG